MYVGRYTTMLRTIDEQLVSHFTVKQQGSGANYRAWVIDLDRARRHDVKLNVRHVLALHTLAAMHSTAEA